ncbi:ABC transporter ATP-binding protein [Isachenkonia alkalipeptolytica]|uniref:ABC transporter ATP-binding protein n=1 Tax=Isachenkonia alkalipeptolytica TaxID=2565777 RepID=A0AA44BEN9_9CLOT|nr:ABC transporter ATP-binding protein [Isachenkonia alkalipeptolytica]NBG89474.1 ABC transporter ATP-binding protein [Isachenkonia alkalipeptolytica]
MKLLQVKDLKTYFFLDKKEIPAVDGVDFHINQGEVLALIGESGSGKSVTSMSIMGLIDEPGKIISGEILLKREEVFEDDLLQKSDKQMRFLRGKEISMIYQDPLSSLHPMIKVGEQVAEALMIHEKVTKAEAKRKTIEMMKRVGISDGEKRYDEFPGQFSGGMRQRIMIAMAIICNPQLLIADEPTTALDVTIQAEILDLLRKLQKENGMSMMLITHDLGVVAEIADRVCVMYCGKIMEETTNQRLFKSPKNPYTKGLMKCIPRIDDKLEYLDTIEGYVPHPTDFPKGCRFSTRCPEVMERCKEELPELKEVELGHKVRCWLYG